MSDPTELNEGEQLDVELSPGEKWNLEGSSSLRQTRLGLGFVYFGIVVILLSALGTFFALFAKLPVTALLVFPVGLIAGSVLIFVGPIVCLAVPQESGAKGLLIGSVVCQVANIVYSVAEFLTPELFILPVKLTLNLSGTLGLILFILFMKKLANFIHRPDLSSKAIYVLVGGALMVVVAILIAVLVTLKTISGLSIVLIPIGALIVFVMYANLVGYLRKALAPRS